ncbi:hypothetical protein NQ318_010860 [Aromia moschata]|uniref:CCHC-type domain-containing protein n=1 Tax=Aromia moschata TaxID=1265417 RepID=A0AAV8XP23_9CUCU|nr:hypothetical protein NQ318_010860 [Aromia moschata]
MQDSSRIDSPASTTSYALTDEQLNSLLTRVQQNQLQLINEFIRSNGSSQTRNGNFVDCTARFNGEKGSDVEAFIDAICIYKDCTQVSDENAIRGLPMLLTGEAATFWLGVKSSVQNWDDVLKTLRSAYSVKLAPYRVYRELFSREQTDDESTELFVCKARALLAQLPDTDALSEKIKLDMIYGLLNIRIRKRLIRDSVQTFDELLKSARSIEQSLAESKVKSCDKSEENDKRKVKRPKCVYCKSFGHEVSDCLAVKRKNEKSNQSTTANTGKTETTAAVRSTISCYGCGAPGVIRSRCTKCNPPTSSKSETTTQESARSATISQFYAADVTESKCKRPILPINICGLNGTAFADTGASCSIMGSNLYHKIKRPMYIQQRKSECNAR